MLRALRNRTYRRLYLAQIVALLGTGLATVALGLLAYDLAGARASQVLGTALAIKMIAYVVVAPAASAVLARVPRRTVLVGADMLRVVVALSLPFVSDVWQVLVLIFVLQAASATFTPTFQAVIPDVLDDEEYTAALSLSRLAYDLESVVSPMLAASLLLVVSSQTLFFGTAAGFAASALLVVSVFVPRAAMVDQNQEQVASRFSVRLRHGTMLFIDCPALRPILSLNLAVAAAGAFVVVQTVVLVRSVLDLPVQVVAWVLAANGLGSMFAAAVLPTVLRTFSERTVMLGGAVALTCATACIPVVLAADSPTVGIVGIVMLWVVVGLGWSAVETPVGQVVRRNVARADLPAAFAAQFSLQHACWLLTYPLAGWLALGPAGTASVLAVLAALATAGAVALWPRGVNAEGVPVSQDVAA